jgi:hypothetical protein
MATDIGARGMASEALEAVEAVEASAVEAAVEAVADQVQAAEASAAQAASYKDAAAASESNAANYNDAAAASATAASGSADGAAVSAIQAQAAVGNISVLPGFYNLKADTTSSNVAVTANYAVLRNSEGNTKTLIDINIDLDVAIGTTLLDDGETVTADDTWYRVWLAYNPTTQAKQLILSVESATAPTLPSGYTHYVFVMCIRGMDGNLYHLHKDSNKKVTYIVDGTVLATALPVLASGTASLTSLYVRDVVPSVATHIQLILYQASDTGNHHLRVQPNGNWTSMYFCAFSYNKPFTVMYLESDYIYWMSGDSDNKIYCYGWIDNL